MNLVIDIGNSSIKAAVFDDGEIVAHVHVEEAEWQSALAQLCERGVVERALVCSVSEIPSGLLDFVSGQGAQTHILGLATRLPYINKYRSPQTLGADRMAAVAGAMMLWPKQNLLVVDVGSCVTYDVLRYDDGYSYLGGTIAPGLRMRLLAMHEHTARLPLVEAAGETPVVGYDTPTAMRSGALHGIEYEIRGFHNQLIERYGAVKLVLTGGDAALVKENSGLHDAEDDLLVLRGLDYILRYNEDEN